MKALTVQQPWAWAIVHGGKGVENRTTPWRHRGELAIHAGTRVSDRGMRSPLVRTAWAEHGEGDPLAALAVGAIIGVVDLTDLHVAMPALYGPSGLPLDSACCDSPWGEQQYERDGRTRRDLVHLVLDHVRPLTRPVPCKGALGLWTVPDDVEAAIRAALT